jgi:acetolactate synthase-1/2/3 large subunit
MRSYQPTLKGHPGQIKRAVDLLLTAKQPMIYTGGGVVLGGASEELRTFVRKLKYPTTSTLMGLGAYPSSDELFLGMLGMHGTYEANMAMHDCDVLIAVGARFDDRVTGKIAEFCPDAQIIHIDVDPSSISKTITVDIPIVGHVADVLADMNALLADKDIDESATADWWAQINAWRAMKCLSYDKTSDKIKPQMVVEMIYEIIQGDVYVSSDVGQHQMWAA